MPLASEFASALGELHTEFGSPMFRFKGRNIPCVASTLGEQIVLDRAGNERQVSLALHALPGQWLTWSDQTVTMGDETFTMGDDNSRPLVGQLIIYPADSSRRFRIAQVRTAPDNSFLHFLCVDPNSNQ